MFRKSLGAIGLAAARRMNFTHEDFKRRHPGGSLGELLRPVTDVLRTFTGRNLPLVPDDMSVSDALTMAARSGRRPGALPLIDRATARAGDPAFDLPKSWIDAKARLDGGVPFNFVSTNDIIGGNSGSPIVDADGEVVGLIFDGNLDSLAGDVVFDMTRNRATSVDARAMLEAMRKVYGAEALAAEITRGK